MALRSGCTQGIILGFPFAHWYTKDFYKHDRDALVQLNVFAVTLSIILALRGRKSAATPAAVTAAAVSSSSSKHLNNKTLLAYTFLVSFMQWTSYGRMLAFMGCTPEDPGCNPWRGKIVFTSCLLVQACTFSACSRLFMLLLSGVVTLFTPRLLLPLFTSIPSSSMSRIEYILFTDADSIQSAARTALSFTSSSSSSMGLFSDDIAASIAFGVNAVCGVVVYLLFPYVVGVFCRRQYVSDFVATSQQRLQRKKRK